MADRSDRAAGELDDEDDRDELRRRYYGLLQELRVLLPGVQILVAFLLTVPFASGFSELDATGRNLYGASLLCGTLAIIFFAAPTVFHRVGKRQDRSHRLVWGIRSTRLGLALFALALLSAVTVVTRVVFSATVTVAAVIVIAVAMVVMWIVVPVGASHRGGRDRDDRRS